MLKSTAHNLLMLTFFLSLSACATPPTTPSPITAPPLPNPETPLEPLVKQLQNEGALCLARQPNAIQVLYLPLASTCASSSTHRWQNAVLNARFAADSKTGQTIRVDSAITHLVSQSPIATTDCAGAHVGRTQLATGGNQYTQEVFWGGRSIGRLPAGNKVIMCVKVDATGNTVPVPELLEQVRPLLMQ